jgi:hypothetical protein
MSAAIQFRTLKPALTDEAHPDHALAALLARAFMTDLPLLEPERLCEALMVEIPPDLLDRPAGLQDVARAAQRVFGPEAPRGLWQTNLPSAPTLRDVYRAIVLSEEFRAAAGQISASYAW